ncbi:MAG TPA: V-type ATP synthase subunit E family protein [Planctomycetota bacterium]|nr:V-type ATP synthase subunit E family protein [Planctomycetota bacterium]
MSKAAGQQASEDALVSEILADASKKAARIIRKAEQDAKQVIEKAEREAQEIRRSIAEAAAARAEKEKLIVLATIDLEARRAEIEAKETLLTDIFRAAEKRTADRRSYDYREKLVSLIASAAKTIGGTSFHIHLGNDDHSTDIGSLQKQVSSKLGTPVELALDPSPAPIDGGVIVLSADGRRLVDNSFAAREERMRAELRRQVAQILFDEKSQQGQHT